MFSKTYHNKTTPKPELNKNQWFAGKKVIIAWPVGSVAIAHTSCWLMDNISAGNERKNRTISYCLLFHEEASTAPKMAKKIHGNKGYKPVNSKCFRNWIEESVWTLESQSSDPWGIIMHNEAILIKMHNCITKSKFFTTLTIWI